MRGYRRYHKTRSDRNDPNQLDTFKEDEDDSGSDSDDNDKRKKSEYRKPWKESTVAASIIDSDVKIGKIVFLVVDIILSKMGGQDSEMRSILLNWVTQIIQSYCKSQVKPHTGYSCVPFSRIAVYIINYHVFSQGKKLKKTSICTKRTLQT